MPRPQNLIPSFQKHIASGQAFVEIDGRPIYLGLHGTDYARTIGSSASTSTTVAASGSGR